MDFKLDCHCHTLASGHAYSTVKEYATSAKDKGLELIAVTDHGPEMPGSCHIFYFENLKVLPTRMNGVEILKGAEVNILDSKGTLDLPERLLEVMDIIIVSMHKPCFDNSEDIEINTQAVINALRNPFVKILGHPDDSKIPLDYEKVVKAACDNKVLIEINNSSLGPNSYRLNAVDNYKVLLKECIRQKTPVIVNSDAHVHSDIGSFQYAKRLLSDINFPTELIMNTSTDKLKKWNNRHK